MKHSLHKAKHIFASEGLWSLIKKGWNYSVNPLRMRFDMLLSRFFAPLSVRYFHKLFYYAFFTDMYGQNKDIKWLGTTISKCPMDMWVYQEIMWEMKPDLIIETGTDRGGSALFFATLCDVMGRGEVITIDVTNYSEGISHPRLTKIQASSTAPETIEKVKERAKGKKVMVVLDSDHSRDHVFWEMELYSELVSMGQYMVVEDSNINGHPVSPGWGPGPMEAIRKFMKTRKDFVIDRHREKFMLTFYPSGFLKKVSSEG